MANTLRYDQLHATTRDTIEQLVNIHGPYLMHAATQYNLLRGALQRIDEPVTMANTIDALAAFSLGFCEMRGFDANALIHVANLLAESCRSEAVEIQLDKGKV